MFYHLHMKTNRPTDSSNQNNTFARVMIPAIAIGLSLSSCVVSERGHYGGRGYHGREVTTVGVGVGYYDTLPATYNDPYYYYNNRYYYGGTWEQGRYLDGGRYYDGRYVHNGHYYYGGRYSVTRAHTSSSKHHDYHRDHDYDRR